jgi:hypothetical protein
MTDKTLKLKAILLSTDGGDTWQIVHQFYLSRPQNRELLDTVLEGRQLIMKGENKNVEQDGQS